MTRSTPDLFTHVHQGIRSALFEACLALGRAGDHPERSRRARRLLEEAIHFVVHHGENEDRLLVPRVAARAPSCAARLEAEHERLEPAIASLRAAVATAPVDALRVEAEAFTASYLLHMHVEEQQIEPLLRAAIPAEELAAFSKESVARTSPDDQLMMLGWMLPAIPREDAMVFLARLPPAVADPLRARIERP